MRAESVESSLPAASGRPEQRGAFRLLSIAACLAWGLATATLIFPIASRSLRLALRGFWARSMLHAIGIELRVDGEAIAPGSLVVANHVSWLDVLALASRSSAVFVAKSEVRCWPAIGWLAARAETVFLQRESGRSLLQVKNRIAGLLLEGRSVALFPEGTTTDGAAVLPFRSGLMQSAVDAGRPVQAIAIAYRDGLGGRSVAAAFVDGMTLCQSILAVCKSGRVSACVSAAPPLAPAGRTRKRLARESHEAVGAMLGMRN
jgi:1-acyl-sn-glycerol-3-phosphate acyltransferase